MADRVDRRAESKQDRWWRLTSIIAVLAVVISGVVGPSFAALAESAPDDSTTVESQPVVVTPAPATVDPPTPTVDATNPTTTTAADPVEVPVQDGEPALALPMTVAPAPVIALAPTDLELLTLTKTVAPTSSIAKPLAPGQTFDYLLFAGCNQQSCVNGAITDTLPAALDGFLIGGVKVAHTGGGTAPTVTWNGTPTQPATVGMNTTLVVTAQQDLGAGSVGILVGQGVTVTLSLQAPDNLPPTWKFNDKTITNTATVDADNSLPATSDADVVVHVDQKINVGVQKTWLPTSAQLNPGAKSTISLKVTNTSNVAVDTLMLQEPTKADENATTLDATNPFRIVDFDSFENVAMPVGATAVTAEVYVLDAGKYVWKAAVLSGSAPIRPVGIDPAEVAGIRLTFTGAIAVGTVGSFDIAALQRATFRDTGSALLGGTTVTNKVTGTATKAGLPPVPKDATASHSLTAVPVGATITKNIDPGTVVAGLSSKATLVARNTASNARSLTISDQGYFVQGQITFGGFVPAPVAPSTTAGTTLTGSVTWTKFGGTTEAVAFIPGQTPALPAAWTKADVGGFDLTWSATNGFVTTTASKVVFGIETSRDAAAILNPRSTTNTAGVSVAYPNGTTAKNTATSGLTIVAPTLDVAITKKVVPGTPVRAGDLVTVTLQPSISAAAQYITPDQLVVEDVLGAGADHFWGAFDLYAIAPTSVPGGSTLRIEVLQADGTTWKTIVNVPKIPGGQTVSLTNAELATAAGVDPATLTGVRFTYKDALGIENTVRPNLTFQARDTIRDTATPTAVAGGPASTYVNTATAEGHGTDDGGKEFIKNATATGQAKIDRPNGSGSGIGVGYSVAKQWQDSSGRDTTSLAALSHQQAQTSLQWRVSTGFDSVTLQDHSNSQGVSAQTVYDAFNLVHLRPSTTAENENLLWDKITAIQIFDGTAWSAPDDCPASGNYVTLVPSSGVPTSASFAECTLTTAEQASTTAFRITVAENTTTRQAAALAGIATAPTVGSGVATGPREFRLVWELRNTLRSNPATFITKDTVVNIAGQAGVIRNTVRLTPARGVVNALPVEASDDITVVNLTPGAAISKSVAPAAVTMPAEGTSADEYPTVTFTSTARNTGPVLAQYVRITDPQTCVGLANSCTVDGTAVAATANPYSVMPAGGWLTMAGAATANPFDSFTITKVRTSTSRAREVDLGASKVWLLRYVAGSYTSTETTAAVLNAMSDVDSETYLANVIGVTVTFQSTDPAVTGGTIAPDNALNLVISTRLRDTVRSTGQLLTILPNTTQNVTNTATTQVWDTVLNNNEKFAAGANAVVKISGQTIDVAPGKAITPASILAVNRNVPVSVTLSGDPAGSSLPPKSVWLQDDATSSPDFWATFELESLGTTAAPNITAPSGADRVQIDLRVGGVWVEGSATAIAAFPTLPMDTTLTDVTGIKVTFSKDGGAYLATAWGAASVPLTFAVRDTYVFPASGTQSVANKMSIQAVRVTVPTGQPASAQNSDVKTAVAKIDLVAGSFTLAVKKESTSTNFPTRLAEVGVARPWTLTFQNTGTGALDIPSLVDDLGPSLVPGNPLNLKYATTPGGTLATDPLVVQHVYDPVEHKITFAWPDGRRAMQPGEVFTITLDLVLQPGLTDSEMASNTMVVNTAQSLASCTNINPDYVTNPNMGVIFDPAKPTSCGTRNFVQPATSLNLYVEKSVFGSRGTAATKTGAVCAATTTGLNGQSYFPSPCLSDTVYSTADTAPDQWLLRTSNTTTEPVTKLVLFDEVPVSGDKLLIGGASRGSDYRPVLTGPPMVLKSAGVTILTTTTEVTYQANACQGTWTFLNTAPGKGTTPCLQNGATWVVATGADWSKVAAIRVTITFDPAAPLSAGKSLDVAYATVNLIGSTPETGLSSVVPIGNQEAWNQFGIQWQFKNGVYSQRIPSVVGITPIAGPLEIRKVVDGTAAESAPTTFEFEVACTIAQPGAAMPTVLTLPNGGKVTVSRSEDGTYMPARIDGIPVGAQCSVIETDNGGATSSTIVPGSVTIEDPVSAEGVVPTAQVVTATNTFDVGQVSVEKVVDGPFELSDKELENLTFSVRWVASNGDDGVFELSGESDWTAVSKQLPVGTTVTLTELDTPMLPPYVGFVRSTWLPGEGIDVSDDGVTATVEVGGDIVGLQVENTFELLTGSFEVNKQVTGPEASALTPGQQFTVNYTYDGLATPGTLTVTNGATVTSPQIPAGTKVTISEVRPEGGLPTDATWGTPVFVLSDGTTVTGSVTITIGDGTAVQVLLENPTVAPPPAAQPPVPSTPPGTDLGSGVVTPPPTNAPGSGSLGGYIPTTGSGTLDILLAAIATSLVGVALLTVGRHRRRGERGRRTAVSH